MLEDLPGDSYEGIMINAMEWFLADGVMTLKGQDHRVADLLLDRGGPLFSAITIYTTFVNFGMMPHDF
jgi:hypothetical protein